MTAGGVFRGVLPAVATPFGPDLEVDESRFIAHCRWLLDRGATGLSLFGTTGEANSLAVAERMRLLETLVEADVDPALIMAGTGASALPEAVELTRHALRAGAGGVLMLPPFYYKALDDDGLYGFFAEVIERVGDQRLKIYLYHIPPVAVVGFGMALLERLIGDYPDTVVGLKDSSGDWDHTRALIERFPGFAVFAGSETFLLATLRAGGAGSISATGNVNPAGMRAVYDHWQGDAAQARQDAISAVRAAIQRHPMIPAVKALLARRLADDVWRRPRPPLVALAPAAADELYGALDALGFDPDG